MYAESLEQSFLLILQNHLKSMHLPFNNLFFSFYESRNRCGLSFLHSRWYRAVFLSGSHFKGHSREIEVTIHSVTNQLSLFSTRVKCDELVVIVVGGSCISFFPSSWLGMGAFSHSDTNQLLLWMNRSYAMSGCSRRFQIEHSVTMPDSHLRIRSSVSWSGRCIQGVEGKRLCCFCLLILLFHSEWSAWEWLRFLCITLQFYLFIWLFWKGESENGRKRIGFGWWFASFWMGWMTERMALFEKHLKWISLNSFWVEWRVGWSVGVRLVGELGWNGVRIVSNENQWGMSWRRVVERLWYSMWVQVEISKVVEKPVAHKSVVHVALSGTVGYEPFFKWRVWVQEQIGRRVSGLCGCLG